jgi:hypothetical protein
MLILKSERLAGMNLLVEGLGWKIQSHDISESRNRCEELLEKVLLEAELLDLKSNQTKQHKELLLKHSWTKEKDMFLPF